MCRYICRINSQKQNSWSNNKYVCDFEIHCQNCSPQEILICTPPAMYEWLFPYNLAIYYYVVKLPDDYKSNMWKNNISVWRWPSYMSFSKKCLHLSFTYFYFLTRLLIFFLMIYKSFIKETGHLSVLVPVLFCFFLNSGGGVVWLRGVLIFT